MSPTRIATINTNTLSMANRNDSNEDSDEEDYNTPLRT